ncbi:hypothetical protein [Myxococcus hansupus]|uniref:hypothetical protein n=1 Tax=Pseudomyxococcus hansupus TaxID=1297742 RepID=UPI0005D11157|nr:hypothetical protein [Myxococcus hansupus]
MLRFLVVTSLCVLGLTACGSDKADAVEELGSAQQGLACEWGTGACPGNTVCAYFPDTWEEGLCRPPCINGGCESSANVCCTQRNGAPYCNSSCF